MINAFTILAGFVFPMLLVLVASAMSLLALRQHLTVRQLLFTSLVLVTGVSSIALMYGSLAEQHAIAVWPILLIGFTVIFSMMQFGMALLLSAVTRLRRIAAR
jgi:hypothetical protein